MVASVTDALGSAHGEAHLIVDGMLSGTGIRNAVAGGYVDPNQVGLSADLARRLAKWLLAYENVHYHRFADRAECERLDQEGVGIARQVQQELAGVRVDYFSSAEMRRIAIPSVAGENGAAS